jgi:hypothetical protein
MATFGTVPITLYLLFTAPLWFTASEREVVITSLFAPRGINIPAAQVKLEPRYRHLNLRSEERHLLLVRRFRISNAFRDELEFLGFGPARWPRPRSLPGRASLPLGVSESDRMGGTTPGRAYFDRELAEGKTKKEALRALKRRISDAVSRQLQVDKAARS